MNKIPIDTIELPHRTFYDPEVEYVYHPGEIGSYWEPPEPDSAEIINLYNDGVLIPYTEWIDWEDEIEQKLLAELDKDRWSE